MTEMDNLPHIVAVIVDGVVKQTMRVDSHFITVLLEQPTFVEFTGDDVKTGDTYADGKFTSVTQ